MITSIKKYIGWDTSTTVGIITAFESDGNQAREIVSWKLNLETNKHSERLLWCIDTVLKSAGWKIEEISGIVVGVGPGSFTGIRIGLTSAKIFSRVLSIPLIPVSSLKLFGSKLSQVIENELIVICNDATKGEWFSIVENFSDFKESLCDLQKFEKILNPEQVKIEINRKLDEMKEGTKIYFFGNSIERYPQVFSEFNEQCVHIESTLSPDSLFAIGSQAVSMGLFFKSDEIKPRYLRDSDAQIKLKNGLLKANPLVFRDPSA